MDSWGGGTEFSEASVIAPCKPSTGFIGAITEVPDRRTLLAQVNAARAVYKKLVCKHEHERNMWNNLALRAAFDKYEKLSHKAGWFKSPEGGLRWDGDLDRWVLEEDFIKYLPSTSVGGKHFTGHSSGG